MKSDDLRKDLPDDWLVRPIADVEEAFLRMRQEYEGGFRPDLHGAAARLEEAAATIRRAYGEEPTMRVSAVSQAAGGGVYEVVHPAPTYYCAGPRCPGLPYEASDMPHPDSCAAEFEWDRHEAEVYAEALHRATPFLLEALDAFMDAYGEEGCGCVPDGPGMREQVCPQHLAAAARRVLYGERAPNARNR